MIIEDSRNKSNMIGPTSRAGTDNQLGTFQAFCGIRVAQTLVVCVVFCIPSFELRMINVRLFSLFATQYTKNNNGLLWHMTQVYSRKSCRIVYIPHMGM